jgi:hypothetical protein
MFINCHAALGETLNRKQDFGKSTRLRIWGSGVRISSGAPI